LKRTIFYSWQSDLPNKTNWGFIEDCIVSSTKELKKIQPVPININIDRATREETGSPDITESIFSKISNSSVFIADISIVNNFWLNKKGRKTPNPNVLIELGYAARTIGWEKIICIFNTDYGKLSDLPFDLRNRRIMPYSLKNKIKPDVKKGLSNQIKKSIIEMQSKGILTDKILDFLKKEIDQEMLMLISHLVRFINKSESDNFFDNTTAFINLDKSGIIEILKDKKILGFDILKSFHEHEKKFYSFVNQAMGSQYYNREILNSLIDIYEWFSEYDKVKTNYFSRLLVKLDEKKTGFYVVHSSKVSEDNNFNKRYLLMKKIDDTHGQVANLGDFYSGNVENLIYFYKLEEKYLDKYAGIISLLIKSFNKWLQLTNNEIIMDFAKTFRVKKSNGEWL